jgi:hypothetical protein
MTTSNPTTPKASTGTTAVGKPQASPSPCCFTHDGPHVHGCTRPRDEHREEHTGACVKGVQDSQTPDDVGSADPIAEGLGGADSLIEDPNDWEEPHDYTLRQRLGLRPVSYPESGTHPDQRPCPPWCVVKESEYDHEIDPARPFTAEHYTNMIATVASAYTGTTTRSGGRLVTPATIETMMQQLGDGRQRINVYLRHYPEPQRKISWTRQLALGVTDAKELVTVLSYLIGQAEAGEVLRDAER